jgi:hypothetical protein
MNDQSRVGPDQPRAATASTCPEPGIWQIPTGKDGWTIPFYTWYSPFGKLLPLMVWNKYSTWAAGGSRDASSTPLISGRCGLWTRAQREVGQLWSTAARGWGFH